MQIADSRRLDPIHNSTSCRARWTLRLPGPQYSLDRGILDRKNHRMSATRICRPVGQRELDLIEASDWTRFPPRLDWQPIFYPVLTEDYAVRIARDWNTKDEENGSVGYVTVFYVDSHYLTRYEARL